MNNVTKESNEIKIQSDDFEEMSFQCKIADSLAVIEEEHRKDGANSTISRTHMIAGLISGGQ